MVRLYLHDFPTEREGYLLPRDWSGPLVYVLAGGLYAHLASVKVFVGHSVGDFVEQTYERQPGQQNNTLQNFFFLPGQNSANFLYFLEISPGDRFVLDLSEVDVTVVVSWICLQVDWTPGIVDPVVGRESLSSGRLSDSHVKLRISHAS